MSSSTPGRPDYRGVRRAYDTVALDYASYLPDTRAEAPLDLAMVDTFARAVTAEDDPRVLDAGCGTGRLTGLPYPDDRFAGVMLWYSIIHTPPTGLAAVFAEAARVLRPGGHLLVGFQTGHGTRDVSGAYRRFGHEVQLERHCYPPGEVVSRMEAAGLHEEARMVRSPRGAERDGQAVLLGRSAVRRRRAGRAR